MAGRKKRLGVIGTFVWDIIYGRDPRERPVEEWGGITYALSALDAALPDDWEIVPLVRVGDDLANEARRFLSTLRRIASDAPILRRSTRCWRALLRRRAPADARCCSTGRGDGRSGPRAAGRTTDAGQR